MFPKLICVIACVRRSLFFYWWVLHSMFICLPVDRHLGCFQSWLLGLDCYGHLCTSFCKYVFISLQKIPKSRAAELEGGQLLNFIGNCQTGLQSGCTFFFFYQHCMTKYSSRFISSPSFGATAFLILVILMNVI